jgi:hypothetical protein
MRISRAKCVPLPLVGRGQGWGSHGLGSRIQRDLVESYSQGSGITVHDFDGALASAQ